MSPHIKPGLIPWRVLVTTAGAQRALLRAAMAGAFAALLSVAQGAALGDVPEESRDSFRTRFLSEYPSNVARLQAPLKNIHCRFSASMFRTAKKKALKGASSGHFFVKGQSREVVRLFAADDERLAGQRLVFCITPEVTFDLRSMAPDAPYTVQTFDDTGDYEKRESASRSAEFYVDSILRAALQARSVPVAALLERSTMGAIRNIEADGKRCLEISFRCDRAKCLYKSCRVEFDPEMEYAVREYEYELWPPPSLEAQSVSRRGKGTIKCERTKEGYIIPTYVREEDVVMRPGSERVASSRGREYRIELVSIGDVPDSQFTLSAFGLPEVSLRRGRRWYPLDRWYFWSLIVAGVGGWLYSRSKRRSRACG